ncbi:hypothetical protein CHARACLAT_007912 [Characodon lateralis]|uniref:Uncharacterized protein n=1 Tax=Characodon lateralis TaxID=208331 RepID=A0ABU7EKI6_9TELE|nr:hypothetical protein [Characodon lateralis]
MEAGAAVLLVLLPEQLYPVVLNPSVPAWPPRLSISVVDADGCDQEGSPVEVNTTADLKKPLTGNTLMLYDSLIKRILRVVCNVPYFMKYPSLHNYLQRFQGSPQNRAFCIQHLAANTEGPKVPQDVQ